MEIDKSKTVRYLLTGFGMLAVAYLLILSGALLSVNHDILGGLAVLLLTGGVVFIILFFLRALRRR